MFCSVSQGLTHRYLTLCIWWEYVDNGTPHPIAERNEMRSWHVLSDQLTPVRLAFLPFPPEVPAGHLVFNI